MHNHHLQARNLSCSRNNDKDLFSELSFSVKSGEILFITGANGSGKSSLLRIVAGLLTPNQGEIRWNGCNINDCQTAYQNNLVYLGHKTAVKKDLTVLENLQLALIMGWQITQQQIKNVLIRFNLLELQNQLVKQLSAGQKQRVALARILLANVKLWILDEPFTAIDQAGLTEMQTCITEHSQKGGITLFSSHIPLTLPDVPIHHVAL